MGKRGRRARRRRQIEDARAPGDRAEAAAPPEATVRPVPVARTRPRLDDLRTARVQGRGAGRFTLTAQGPREHHEVVARALSRAARVRAGFDRDHLWALLREGGVPNHVVARIVESVIVEDEVYARPPTPTA